MNSEKNGKILHLIDISKNYLERDNEIEIFKNLSISFKKGEISAIQGVSGCGKSTFINLCGGLDNPTTGNIFFKDYNLSKCSDILISQIRLKEIGILFQNFNLLSEYSVYKNLELPLKLNKVSKEERDKTISKILSNLALEGKKNFKPSELSGGENQRVAIGRAIINNPALLLLDEPTGDLDRKNSDQVMNILLTIVKELNTTVIITTHDNHVANLADNIYLIENYNIINKTNLL